MKVREDMTVREGTIGHEDEGFAREVREREVKQICARGEGEGER